jgi:hypothetical protein
MNIMELRAAQFQLRQRIRRAIARLHTTFRCAGIGAIAARADHHDSLRESPHAGMAKSFFAALPGKKKEVWMQSKGQIDFYDDHRLIDPSADLIASFSRPNAGL